MSRRWVRVASIPLILFALSSCVRREGRNADCHWPAGPPQQLRDDVELAEELAIEHMDARFGPRDAQAASRAKNECMGRLLHEIGKAHGITAEEAFKHFGERNPAADAAMFLPFLLVSIGGADFIARRIRGGAAILLAAFIFGIAVVLLGEYWSMLTEIARIGNTHLSNRALRLPAVQHRGVLFGSAVLLFLLTAAYRSRPHRPQ